MFESTIHTIIMFIFFVNRKPFQRIKPSNIRSSGTRIDIIYDIKDHTLALYTVNLRFPCVML